MRSPVTTPRTPEAPNVGPDPIAPAKMTKAPARAPTIPVRAAIRMFLKMVLSCRSSEMSFTATMMRM